MANPANLPTPRPRDEQAAKGTRYTKEPSLQEQASLLQPVLVAASVLGGAGTLPPYDCMTTEQLDQRAITLGCFAEICSNDPKQAQELFSRDEERIAFAPMRVHDIYR